MDFVRLTNADTGLSMYANVNSINAVYVDVDVEQTCVDVQSSMLWVKETPEQVMAMINGEGEQVDGI